MSFWFFLWFLFSFILLGTTVWNTIILLQQKRAWKGFSDKYKLTYTPNKFFESPTVEGVIDGFNVSLFSAMQQNPDARKNRQVTVFQLNVNYILVNGFAAGTSEMLAFLQILDATTPHDIKQGKWDKKFYIRSHNKKAVDAYLTAERVKIICNILSMPNSDNLILFNDEEGVFRFETPNPLKSQDKIENLLDKLSVRVKKLTPDEAEATTLRQLEKSTDATAAEEKGEEEVDQPKS